MARPKEWTPARINKVRLALEEYTETTEIPIIADFAYKNHINRQTLYDLAEMDSKFSDAMKRIIAKKESALEIKALSGDVVPSMAIFSLKQLGWSDKQDITHSGSLGVVLVDDIPRKKRD